jgi:hypothetical protein
VEEFISRLQGARQSGDGWTALCPAHEDTRASLSIGTGDDGRILVRCHTGCGFDAVVKALGLCPSDLFPPNDHQVKSHADRGKRKGKGKKYWATCVEAVAAMEYFRGPNDDKWDYHK